MGDLSLLFDTKDVYASVLRFAFAFTSLAPSKSTSVDVLLSSPAPQAAGPLATCTAKVPCTHVIGMILVVSRTLSLRGGGGKIERLASKALFKFSSDNPELVLRCSVLDVFVGD